jgi:hypothetical protein
MAPRENEPNAEVDTPLDEDRRKFLAACGKFAVVTPPALTVLLSTSLNSTAIAHSSGGSNPGSGRGGRDKDPWDWLERLLDKLF